jgi:NADPH2:quinone reductase
MIYNRSRRWKRPPTRRARPVPKKNGGRLRAVVATEHGGPAVLAVRELPEPTPGPGEILIRVASAGINFSDLGTIAGTYPGPPPPFVPGIEVAGHEIESGRPVVALVDAGGYAEVALAKERLAFDAEGLELGEAGGYPLALLAAYFGLVRAARLQAGESVLVFAAAGALGSTTIQVARALGASRVIAVASTETKRQVALDLGADEAVAYDSELPPVDVVVDGVGGETFLAGYRAANRFGRVLTVGASAGAPPELPSFQELRERSVAIVPFSFKALRAAEPEYVAQAAPAALDLVRKGEVVPVIGQAVPFEQVQDALGLLAGRASVGKLLLVP